MQGQISRRKIKNDVRSLLKEVDFFFGSRAYAFNHKPKQRNAMLYDTIASRSNLERQSVPTFAYLVSMTIQ